MTTRPLAGRVWRRRMEWMPGRLRTLVFFTLLCAAPALGDSEDAKTPVPYGGTPYAIPGLIEAEHYDEGKEGVAYHDVDDKNEGADYRKETGVDIEERADASNGHGIGWTRKGEWLIYTVTVTEAGHYTLEFPVASNGPGGVFHIEMNGKDVTGPITVPGTGGWDKLKTIKKEDVTLAAGEFQMKMLMDRQGFSGSIGDIDYVRFVKQSE